MKTLSVNDKAVEKVLERSDPEIDNVFDAVKPILKDVRELGDDAVCRYTKKFDGFDLNEKNIRVPGPEIKQAAARIPKDLLDAIKSAHRNIVSLHKKQKASISSEWKTRTVKGVSVTEKTVAIGSVGAYVPGGRASYPSTVLMTCTPAKIAGVKRIVVVSPPPVSDAVLAACDVCGVDEVYRIGGAQAVAALAYGTKSIPKVDKIVGPGNKYVTAAKMLVYGRVDIDMPAGPSEVLIIADGGADARLIASDMLAQAEHDPDARCVLVSDSKALAGQVEEDMRIQLKGLKRKEIIEKSLENSVAILVDSMDDAAAFADRYAPEHLEIMCKDQAKLAKKIMSAGTIFAGPYSPVSAGDYASGTNHVLPTGGAARFSSQLSVRDYLRNFCVQEISRDGLSELRKTIETLAEAEGLQAHKESVRKRFETG